jgi:hypothetical protein
MAGEEPHGIADIKVDGDGGGRLDDHDLRSHGADMALIWSI